MPEIWRDLGALFYLDRMAWKNRLRSLIAHPGRTAWKLAEAVIFLAIVIGPAVIGARGRERPALPVDAVAPIAGVGVFALLVLAFVFSLGPSIRRYAPSCFSLADTQLLFTSRIGARTIYLYALLRGFWRSLLATVITLAPFAGIAAAVRLPLVWGRFGYAIGGLLAFQLFLQAAGFLAFKLNKRFHAERALSIGLYGYLGVIVATWAVIAFASRGASGFSVAALDSPVLAWFPVVGWAKALILAPLVWSQAAPWLLVGMVLVALLNLAAAVLLAADYYEEATSSIEEIQRLASSFREGQTGLTIRRAESRNSTLAWGGRGPAVFLWKDLLVARRRRNWGLIALKYAALFGLGLGVAYLLRNEPIDSVIYIYLLAGFFMGPIFGISPSGLTYEMKHHYLFLLPGRPRDKILNINLWLLCRCALRNVALVSPTLFIGKASPAESLGLVLALTALDAERVSDRAMLRILLPWQKATSPLLQYAENLVQLLFLAPGLIGGVIAYVTLRNWAVTLFAFAAGGLVSGYALLMLSERFFARLELRE